jgi:hypothetical protein
MPGGVAGERSKGRPLCRFPGRASADVALWTGMPILAVVMHPYGQLGIGPT